MMSTRYDTRDELRCLRYPDLVAAGIVGNRQTLSRWIRSGYFPRPIRLGPNVTAWRWTEIRDWLEARERIVTDSERREDAIVEELRAERAES